MPSTQQEAVGAQIGPQAPFSYKALRHLPGIRDLLIGNQCAVIEYQDGRCKRLSADSPQRLMVLLEAWLLPLHAQHEFSTLDAYNRAMDGALERTDPCVRVA